MGAFQLAGKFLANPLARTGLDGVAKLGISQGIISANTDPVNKVAGLLFGLPYLSIPAVGALTLNAGATAPGTLEEARRLGMFK